MWLWVFRIAALVVVVPLFGITLAASFVGCLLLWHILAPILFGDKDG